MKINELGQFLDQVQRVYGLIEQYAVAKSNADMFEAPIRRGFEQLKLRFMGSGFDSLSQLCGAMAMAAKRSGSQPSKARILREGVGSVRFQLELEQRSIVAAEIAKHDKAKEAEL